MVDLHRDVIGFVTLAIVAQDKGRPRPRATEERVNVRVSETLEAGRNVTIRNEEHGLAAQRVNQFF